MRSGSNQKLGLADGEQALSTRLGYLCAAHACNSQVFETSCVWPKTTTQQRAGQARPELADGIAAIVGPFDGLIAQRQKTLGVGVLHGPDFVELRRQFRIGDVPTRDSAIIGCRCSTSLEPLPRRAAAATSLSVFHAASFAVLPLAVAYKLL